MVNKPLADVANNKPCDETRDPLEQADCWQQAQKKVNERDRARRRRRSPRRRRARWRCASRRRSSPPPPRRPRRSRRSTAKKLPVTLGVGEPLTATLIVAGYAALLLTLPLLLYQAYAFVLPAFSPTERQVALPLMVMVPFLFYAGVVFAYFLVLPAAVDFLQNFNDDNYDVLLQARDYNKFAIMVLGVDGPAVPAPRADPRHHAHGDPDPAASCASTGATRSSSSPSSPRCCPAATP